VALVVFDADVLIGFLDGADAHHARAVERVKAAQAAGDRRYIAAVNYGEILIVPLRRSDVDARRVERFFDDFAFDVVACDRALARRAAAVRASTGLKLADAFAVATALALDTRAADPVRLESFDAAVVRAHATLAATG
jgi:predicted nucleic acid-binding protein